MGRPIRVEGPLVHFWFRKRAEVPGAHPKGLWRDLDNRGTADSVNPIPGSFWLCACSQRYRWERGHARLASPVSAHMPLNPESGEAKSSEHPSPSQAAG